jgi:DNA repair photolyase
MKTSVIYETRGKAREYCELAANLYRGCGHCCTYCYAPSTIFESREKFCQPRVRKDVLLKFENDAKYFGGVGESRSILLSFTTDPYQMLDVLEELTRRAIQILHDNNLKVSILTKGGKRSERDFDLLSSRPELSEYGATLVFVDENDRKQVEPFAAPTHERIECLKKAHDMGISTYVSLEPVYDPLQTLTLIDLTYDFVDLYKVGKLNYNARQKTIDWKKFKKDVIETLDDHNKKYYLKESLQVY